MANLKMRSSLMGAHVHIDLFVGRDAGHLQLTGHLVASPGAEAAALERLIMQGAVVCGYTLEVEANVPGREPRELFILGPPHPRQPWLTHDQAMKQLGHPLTWPCMVCGEERPDAQISVHSIDVSARHQQPPGTIGVNVRYCNDRQSCSEAAPRLAWSYS